MLFYPLLGSSHTSTLSLTSERHFSTSMWKPEPLRLIHGRRVYQGLLNTWMIQPSKLEYCCEFERTWKRNVALPSIYIIGGVLFASLFWGFFPLFFFAHLLTLQATSRDETVDPGQLSPSKPSFGMGRLSLKSTNTQDKRYLPMTAYFTWEYHNNKHWELGGTWVRSG